MKLTDRQLHTLRHMLGITAPYSRSPRPYRNYAAVKPGDKHYLELERLGAVERINKPVPDWATDYEWFQCTEAGKAAAMESHRRIRKPKAKRVYHLYLDISDALTGLTFKEFLTSDEFKEVRRNA